MCLVGSDALSTCPSSRKSPTSIIPTMSNAVYVPAYMEHPGLEPRRLRVIGIGAGASGLLLAYKIQRNFDNIELTIFEKNEGACAGTKFHE